VAITRQARWPRCGRVDDQLPARHTLPASVIGRIEPRGEGTALRWTTTYPHCVGPPHSPVSVASGSEDRVEGAQLPRDSVPDIRTGRPHSPASVIGCLRRENEQLSRPRRLLNRQIPRYPMSRRVDGMELDELAATRKERADPGKLAEPTTRPRRDALPRFGYRQNRASK